MSRGTSKRSAAFQAGQDGDVDALLGYLAYTDVEVRMTDARQLGLAVEMKAVETIPELAAASRTAAPRVRLVLWWTIRRLRGTRDARIFAWLDRVARKARHPIQIPIALLVLGVLASRPTGALRLVAFVAILLAFVISTYAMLLLDDAQAEK